MTAFACHRVDCATGDCATNDSATNPATSHPRPTRRMIRILFSLATGLLLAACSHNDAGKDQKAAAATVTTVVIKPRMWSDTIDAIGTAHANESVAVTAKVSETVQRVEFESGDLVRAGQVLVTLSNQSDVAGLDEAAASYRDAEQLFERQQALAARQLIAASAMDTQRAARDAAKARMDQVRASLSDRVIAAPFDGVLGLRQVSPGSLVTPGTVIATLDDVSVIKLDFSIPERFLTALAKGQPLVARSDAYPGEAFEGAIASLDSRVDPVTRAITAQARIANPDRKLRPGMLLEVSIRQPSRQTLQVPEIALQQVGQQAFVFRVAADDSVELVPVTVGARQPGQVEILDGLKAGDRVVVEGTVKLHPGSKITEASVAPASVPPNRG
jgi:membrane fusion protein (multidrug efflux system)